MSNNDEIKVKKIRFDKNSFVWRHKFLIGLLISIILMIIFSFLYFILHNEPTNNNKMLEAIIFSLEIIGILYLNIFLILAPIFSLIFGYRRGENTARQESLDKIDFANDKDYFREIIDNYSASELLYIDEFKQNEERKAIVLILLKLQLLGKIKINDTDIKIIDSDVGNLKQSEKYIMEHIIDNRVNLDVDGYTYFYTKKDAIEDGLIKSSNKKGIPSTKFISHILIPIGIFIFSIYGMNNYINSSFAPLFFISIIICAFILPTYLLIYTFSYIWARNDSYERTELGKDINKKLNGLKNYIDDFSNLKDADRDALFLWDDYLIYSIMFDINKKVYDKIVNLINIELEHGVLYCIKK